MYEETELSAEMRLREGLALLQATDDPTGITALEAVIEVVLQARRDKPPYHAAALLAIQDTASSVRHLP